MSNEPTCPEIKALQRVAKQSNVIVRVGLNGHVQVFGAILVNYYPMSKFKRMYIAGSRESTEFASVDQVIRAAQGKGIPNIGKTKRLKAYTGAKRRLFKFSQACHWCSCPLTFEAATVDHVIPLARGGLNNMNNYVLACQPCNNGRANSLPGYAQIKE